MNTCKIAVYKTCASCKMGFCDNKWCGELMCQRCLDICWVLDDPILCDILFNCCDYHRPQINLNNITSVSYNDDEQEIQINVKDITQSSLLSLQSPSISLPSTPALPSKCDYNNSFNVKTQPILIPKTNPIIVPKNNDEKGRFDNNPFSQSLPQFNEEKEPFVRSKSFIIAKSYEIKDDISNTFKKYIVDKIKNKDNF